MNDIHIRKTFTLQPQIIELINYYSEYLNLSKSKFISYCISYTFTYMEIELEEMNKGGYSMYQKVGKKLFNTSPLTVTLPKCVLDKFDYYCKELDVKKSHMIKLSVIVLVEDLGIGLEREIEELMESVEIN